MLESKRLILLPLTYEQVLKYLQCDFSLETELNINLHPRTIPSELKEAFENTIIPNLMANPDTIYFSTLWIAYTKISLTMIGDACFTGEPDDTGTVEIGYGTYEEFRNKGYMTEIVGTLKQWAGTNNHVKNLIAVTNKHNNPSFMVLVKNDFQLQEETDSTFIWNYSFK